MSGETSFFAFDGIKGESTAVQGKDKYEVLSYSHGIAMPLTAGASANARAHGRCVHQDFTFTKYLDISSPTLNLKVCGGDNIKTAELTVFQADAAAGDMVQYYKIIFSDCIITNVSVSGGAGGRAIETVTFNYRKIAWSYAQQGQPSPAGKKGTAEGAWDLEQNKKG
jgi:type VI secretion system secreted protein Hcp